MQDCSIEELSLFLRRMHGQKKWHPHFFPKNCFYNNANQFKIEVENGKQGYCACFKIKPEEFLASLEPIFAGEKKAAGFNRETIKKFKKIKNGHFHFFPKNCFYNKTGENLIVIEENNRTVFEKRFKEKPVSTINALKKLLGKRK